MSAAGHKPPPLFNRGITPLAKLFIYTALAIALLAADLRFNALETARIAIGTVIHPLQRFAQAPIDMLYQGSDYFSSHATIREENEALRKKGLASAELLMRQEHLEMENQRLRALLDLRKRQKSTSVAAEIVAAARDPYSYKVFIDKGTQQNIQPGQVVVDENGVVGQVTRVFPLSSEITLLTDKNQTIPVQVLRNGLRTVLVGSGLGMMELRYLASNADIEPGDTLVTSGLDGVYLPGLPVARVTHIDRGETSRFLCVPIAGVEKNSQVLVLGNREAPSGLPVEEADNTKNKRPAKGRRVRRAKPR